MRKDLKPARVSLSGELGPFDVLLAPDRWNGWGVPFFTLAEAQRFLAVAVESGWFKVAEFDGEAFVFAEPDDPTPQRFEANDAGLYCIGGYSWTWEVEPEEEPSCTCGAAEDGGEHNRGCPDYRSPGEGL